MKEDLIRIGCVLLGSFFTFGSNKVAEWIDANPRPDLVIVEEVEASTEDISVDEILIENLKLASKSEKMNTVSGNKAEGFKKNTVSANLITAAKVDWKTDYPAVSSTQTLEEKQAERSSYEESLAVNAQDKEVIANSDVDFSDVKITIMGDSITTGVQLTEEDQKKYSYPVVLQEILGCKEIVNLGIGGSSVSSAGNYPMVERWQDVPADSDIVIIFGGSNDCLFETNEQFGYVEADKRHVEKTFCGDLDTLLTSIKDLCEDAKGEGNVKFIYINPPATILNAGVYESDPENKVHQKTFAAAINTIAPECGFEVIDLYNNNILNSYDKDVNEQFLPDGIHPNVEGHRILAEHIASQIIQRVEQ